MNFDLQVNFVDHMDKSYRALCDEVFEMCEEHSCKYMEWSLFSQRLKELCRLHHLGLKYWEEHIQGTAMEQNLKSIRRDLLESYTKLFIARMKSRGEVVPANSFDRFLAEFTQIAEQSE